MTEERNVMRRTLFNTALENNDVDTSGNHNASLVSAEVIEEANGEIAAVAARADAEGFDQVEMANVSESIEDIRSIVEGSGDEGLSEESQAVVDIALEHLIAQLGISTQRLVSMEQIDTVQPGSARKQASLEELAYIERVLNRGYQVSQEAFSDYWNEFVDRVKLNEEKVIARLRTAADRYKEPGRDVTTGDWAKPLAIAGKTIDGAAIKKEADELFSDDKKVVSLFEKLSSEVKLLTGEIRDTWFFASKHRIESIKALGKQVQDAYEAHDFGPSFRSVDLETPELKALKKSEVRDIAQKLITALQSSELKNVVEELQKQNVKHAIFQMINGMFRIKNGFVRFIAGGIGANIGGALASTGTKDLVDVASTAAGQAIGAKNAMNAVSTAMNLNVAGTKFARHLLNAKDLAIAQDATDYTQKAVITLRQLLLDRIRFSNAVATYIEKSSA